MKKKRTRSNAPLLLSRESRVQMTLHLPEIVKIGVQAAARYERQSESWIVEQVLKEIFGLEPVEYKEKGQPWETQGKGRSTSSARRKRRRRGRGRA
jgi:hypothetical protein